MKAIVLVNTATSNAPKNFQSPGQHDPSTSQSTTLLWQTIFLPTFIKSESERLVACMGNLQYPALDHLLGVPYSLTIPVLLATCPLERAIIIFYAIFGYHSLVRRFFLSVAHDLPSGKSATVAIIIFYKRFDTSTAMMVQKPNAFN